MEFDPSAWFSVLWVGEEFLSTVPDPSLLRELNYTYYGENLYTSQGVWAEAKITMDIDDFDGDMGDIEGTDESDVIQ